jgi:hypothetical protein
MTPLCFATRKRNEAWNPGNFGCRGLLVYGGQSPSSIRLRILPSGSLNQVVLNPPSAT